MRPRLASSERHIFFPFKDERGGLQSAEGTEGLGGTLALASVCYCFASRGPGSLHSPAGCRGGMLAAPPLRVLVWRWRG